MNTKKQAFTLVELIVVITILAILGTIAFLSFTGYSRDSRNSVRYNDLRLIETALEQYHIKVGKYPESTLPVEITFADAEARLQGTFGDSTFGSVGKLDHKPVDPLTGSEYTYSILNTKGEYEVAAALEGTELSEVNIGDITYAGNVAGTSLVLGTYNGKMLKVNTGGLDYVLAVPTIISGDIGLLSIDEITFYKKLAYNGSRVIAGNYKGTDFDMNKTFDYDLTALELIVFTGAIEDLKTDESKRLQLLENLQRAYSGTEVERNTDYKSIKDETIDTSTPSDTSKQLAKNVIYNAFKIKFNNASEISSSSYDIILDNINHLPGNSEDFFSEVIFDGTNYVVVGFSSSDLSSYSALGGANTIGGNDMLIAKFDTDLNLLKLNNLGGVDSDILYSLIYDGSNYVAVGNSNSDLTPLTGGSPSAGSMDFLIAKFDTNLDLVKLNNIGSTLDDDFSSLIYDGTNYVVSGYSYGDLSSLTGGTTNSGQTDNVIVKFDTDLNLVKLSSFGGTNYEVLSEIVYDGSNYISVGYSMSDLSSILGGSNTTGNKDFIISKHDSDLNLIKINNFGGTSEDRFSSLTYDGINYVAGGYSYSDLSSITGGTTLAGGTKTDSVIAKFDSNLDLLAFNNFGGTDYEIMESLVYDSGDYISVGYSMSDLTSFNGGSIPIIRDFIISKHNSDLEVLELRLYGGSGYDRAFSIAKNIDDYIVVGTSDGDNSSLLGGTTAGGNLDAVIFKY